MKFLITLAMAIALAVSQLSAFNFQVKSIERVPLNGIAEAFHPVFSADGSSLFVTSESYDGLGIVNLKDGRFRKLSDRAGAGYKFAQSADGSHVVLRENDFLTQKLSLYLLDVASATEECVVPVMEHTNTLALVDGKVLYAEPAQRKINSHTLRKLSPANGNESVATILTEEDLKLVLYRNEERTEIDPVMQATGRDLNYCWSSLSPDGTRMLFVAANDAYTCRLDGSDLVNLGPIHAPVWLDNNTVIAMKDSDDGHFFTASDIVAADIRTAETMQLTPVTDEIKMFPSVSPDGSRIAFHTTQGNLYIINLETK